MSLPSRLLLAAFLLLCVCAQAGMVSAEQVVLFSENFDDGNWTEDPFWFASPADPSVTISTEQCASSPCSLKIDANASSGAIRSTSGLRNAEQPFTCTFNIYVQSIPEEGIPWSLHDSNGGLVALIFLLPGGRVDLTAWKPEGGYVKATVPYPLSYGVWHSFEITYDGAVQRLYIDGRPEPDAVVDYLLRAAPVRICVGNFQLAHTGTYYIDDIVIRAEQVTPQPPGKVYVQFCSDTSTGGLATNSNPIKFPAADETYTSPTGQAAQVMAEDYRNALRDSLGNTLKVTWYMNCGSIYSCGIDTTPILPYELLEDNHGEAIARWGDEMAFHYHTWAWTDPDGDGVYQWNQTETFLECLTDFDATIAQFVLDRGFFPTSFRSGWNWMDNPWESYLDQLFPYRFEGRWFQQGWTPYHPSFDDWRVPGTMRGWEAYHDYIPSFSEMDAENSFLLAQGGLDQVVTLWSHLKETDYADQIATACSYLEAAHQRYPDVEFEYLTARECMLKWRKGADVTAPAISLSATDSGSMRTAVFSTDEEIYQSEPFVARKGLDGSYTRVPCMPAGPNTWTVTYDLTDTAGMGIGLTDWFGNSSVRTLPVPFRMSNLKITTTSTTAEAHWETNSVASAHLECTLVPDGATVTIDNSTGRSPHKATFTGLLSGHVYRIRLTATGDAGESVSSDDCYVLTKLSEGTVVDNVDPGFTVSGTWSTGSTAGGRYGADYRYASTSPSGTSRAEWTMSAPSTGLYAVQAWWSQGTNRSSAAPFWVLWRGLEVAAAVNQQIEGGQWNLLGTFPLEENETITVRLTNRAPSGYVVIADAARLEQAYPPVDGPGLARLLSEGERISLPGLVVTAVFGDCFFAQAADRSAGVRVESIGVSEGDRVTVHGEAVTVDGVFSVVNPVVTVEGSGVLARPLRVSNAGAQIESRGARTAGLLVTVCGRVASAEGGFFVLDDGSGAPVRVESERLDSPPQQGAFAAVTGVQGAVIVDGAVQPLIRPRGTSDFTTASNRWIW